MVDLPGDLLEEILCRVPASSLKQLRTTCKQWNRLFNDSKFARKHFDKAPKQFLPLMLTKKVKVCSLSFILHGFPSVEIRGGIDPLSSLDQQFEISEVSHCDGLLLCTNVDNTRLVVWNPCTGQTKWIQPRDPYKVKNTKYVLGSYGYNTYKILSYRDWFAVDPEFAIYELSSNSWRVLDVTLDCKFSGTCAPVSFKGKTYWYAYCNNEGNIDPFLVSFDYTTERFGRLPLPHRGTMALSAVRDERLAVLVRIPGKEISVYIDAVEETKVVSWRKVLAVDCPTSGVLMSCFLADEEKKLLLYGETCTVMGNYKSSLYVYRDGNRDTKLDLKCWPLLNNYVPSLVQIQQTGGGKRKRAT